MSVVQVALPIPKRQLFDYLNPGPEIAVGSRVLVPFGRRSLIGIVMANTAESDYQLDKLKAIENVIDTTPALTCELITLCKWLSQYYQHPIGEVLTTALPAVLRKGESSEPRPLTFLMLTELGEQTDISALSRSPKQQILFEFLKDGEKSLVLCRERVNTTVINGLIDKGLAQKVERAAQYNTQWRTHLHVAAKPTANIQQALAIEGINQNLGGFHPFLLEGVTGSGKTEVYLQCIEEVLKLGKQVLVLVPEIGLTPQTVMRFEKRFGLEVGILHSNLNDNERLQVWQRSQAGELAIVIGTRSAIFTPLKYPGMLIVDEEHDGSYKQQDGLRYSARDLAIVRGKDENIPVILGSATPSLESLNNALQGRYQHFVLQQRAGNASHTRQNVLDIKGQPLQSGLAPGMVNTIRQHLQQGSQVMLFINRRGYAPALVCHSCGYVEECRSCNKPYTLHKQLNKLQCHHCGAARGIPQQCQHCGSDDIEPYGLGTEQLEQSLAKLFEGYPSIRIDSDTTRGKNRLQEMLDKVNKNQYQLLVGTQILSKGHHFPNVTLVVILDADGALFSADFRAAEHLAQLITQLSGRAGRAEKPGEMWLQTHNPSHPLLQDLIHNGYAHFARHALSERQQAGLPPFHYQALFRAESNKARDAHEFLSEISRLFPGKEGVSVIGPIPAIMEKRQGRFRLQLLLQSPSRGKLQRVLSARLNEIENMPLARKVRWSVDVDPQDFM